MALSDCNSDDIRIIGACLRAAAAGHLIPESEMELLVGATRQQIARVASEWPRVDADDPIVKIAVSGTLNNLLGYPPARERWDEYIAASPESVSEAFMRWRA